MAKSKEGMKEMLKRMENYLKRKKLAKYGKVKNGLFQRRKRKKKEDGIELGRSENKRGE